MIKFFKKIFSKKTHDAPVLKKGWAKIEDCSDGPVSWTNYYNHDGTVFMIYNLMMSPGFSGATLTNIIE